MKTAPSPYLRPMRSFMLIAAMALVNACGTGGGSSQVDSSAAPLIPNVTINAAVGTGTEPTTGLANAQAATALTFLI